MRRWIEMVAAGQSPRRVVLDLGMYAAASLAEAAPIVRERRAQCRLVEDLTYARVDGQALQLDLLIPTAATGPHPVLIYFHGGAFAIGSRRTHRALAMAYAARGWLVAVVDYRLAPQFPFPAAVEDACAAWTWVVRHAAGHGGDPSRIVVGGESAGANLALAVALACTTPRPEPWAAPLHAADVRPAALLLYYGFLQASQPQRYRRAGVSRLAAKIAEDAARSYLGPAADAPGAGHAMADPLCLVEGLAAGIALPPAFIAAGEADPCLPDSQRLVAALQRRGLPHELRLYPGQPHGFHVLFWREAARQCWRDSFAFLDRLLAVGQSKNSRAATEA